MVDISKAGWHRDLADVTSPEECGKPRYKDWVLPGRCGNAYRTLASGD